MSKSGQQFLEMQEEQFNKQQFMTEVKSISKKLPAELELKLKAPLPLEALKVHPTKSFLTVISPAYVVERLNDCFGIGGWKLRSRVIDKETSHIVVQSLLLVAEYGIEIEAFGGNRNDDLGDSFKGAQTDALTKAASYLGIGLEIYKGLGPKIEATKVEKNKFKSDLTQETEVTEKPWLNIGSKPYLDVQKALNKGYTIEQVRKKYRVSKKVADTLMLAIIK